MALTVSRLYTPDRLRECDKGGPWFSGEHRDNISGGAAIEQVSLSKHFSYAILIRSSMPFGHLSQQQLCMPIS